ncbi:MAG: cytochrome c-type biogenesis protein [Gammaproteobacteria bacterium]
MNRRPVACALAVALLCLLAAAAPVTQAAPAVQAALAAAPAALDAHGQLRDPALQARFEQITKELRCLVCQNESIADSNAELAGDLRGQVQELLVAGKSDDAIFKYMTDRYGEFVRFSPPLETKTLFIWGAPFLMLVLGGVIVFRIVRKRASMPLDDDAVTGPDLR